MHYLITGASSGLGEAMARRLATKGHHVTLVARRQERLEALAASLPAQSLVCPADLTDLDRCAAVVEQAVAAHGPIDVLINNAGIQYVEPTVGVSPERGERLMTVNVLAPMRLIHHVLPSMIERKQGCIVNIASLAGMIFTPGMTHYNASKAALAAASESLRVEVAGEGVHVLTVYPGPVHSEMEAAAKQAFEQNSTIDVLPTGTPEGLADRVAKAIDRKSPRVIYPAAYTASRYTRVFSQWITDRLTPPLKQ